jgi:hypothetical protein
VGLAVARDDDAKINANDVEAMPSWFISIFQSLAAVKSHIIPSIRQLFGPPKSLSE